MKGSLDGILEIVDQKEKVVNEGEGCLYLHVCVSL
jgi:hypothetical protein